MSHYDKRSNGWASVETSVDETDGGFEQTERNLDLVDAMAHAPDPPISSLVSDSCKLSLAFRKLSQARRDMSAIDRMARTYWLDGHDVNRMKDGVGSVSLHQVRNIIGVAQS